MYVKLFTTVIIGLFTARIVLQVLGASDYGLFNVVGGILAMFTIFSNSLGVATTRFLNVEMGKIDGNLNKAFNINLALHIGIAILIFIIAEILGVIYINNYLNVAAGKEDDAMFIFQVSIITACIGIINTPYNGLFNAKEKFSFLACLEIANTVIRLLLVILLQYYHGNCLRLYGIFMSVTTIDSFIIYRIIARKQWNNIIKWNFDSNWRDYKDVLVFNNWNLLSTTSMIARTSGSDILINLFFGTITNGAYAVSKTVNNYLVTFASNFDAASTPQIIQSYTAGDEGRCKFLINKLGRINLLLFLLAFFPLYVRLDFILHLWLDEVPDNTLIFCQLNLILAYVSLTGGGIVQLINASGKLKWFSIEFSIFFLTCIPVGFLLFKLGAPAYVILLLFILADGLQRIIQLILAKTILHYDSLQYVKDAYTRPLLITVFMSGFMYAVGYLNITGIIQNLFIIAVTFILTLFMVYYVGLSTDERQVCITTIKQRFFA